MKNVVKIGIGIGIAVVFLAIIADGAPEYDEPLNDPKFQANLVELSKAGNDLLNICMNTENLEALYSCRNVSIPQLLNNCKDKYISTLEICSDPRLAEFSITIDERIDAAEQHVSELKQEIEDLEVKIEEIRENELPYLFYESQYDKEVITDYRQLLRACIRHAEEWNIKYSGIEEYDEFDISKSYLREDLNFCEFTIKEIEDKCEFHELCSGIEKFHQIRNQLITTENANPSCSGTAQCISGTVTRVIDGDTLEVNGQSIRFALSSAPEMDTDKGVLTKDFVEKLCPTGSQALVDEDDKQTQGSYGRILGIVYCNGVNLNEAILESGYGWISTSFCSKSEFANHDWAKKHGC